MAFKRFYAEYKAAAKKANRRMRELERRGLTSSPAYENVQALLEQMGVKTDSAAGRRFSESGKASYNQMEQWMKAIQGFLGSKTSTMTGFNKWRDNVWDSANMNNQLSKAGVSKEDYFEFWKNFSDKEGKKMYDSGEIVKVIKSYYAKNKNLTDEQKLTGAEIADLIVKGKDYKTSLKNIGLTTEDIQKFGDFRDLGEVGHELFEEGTNNEVRSKNSGRNRRNNSSKRSGVRTGKR